jgi:hypothetical protein
MKSMKLNAIFNNLILIIGLIVGVVDVCDEVRC